MEQRRFLTFIALSALVIFGWSGFVMPMLFPPKPKVVEKLDGGKLLEDVDAALAKREAAPADALQPANVAPAEVAAADQPAAQPEPGKPAADRLAELKKFPNRQVLLGSTSPDQPFFLGVTLNSRGAAVETIELNDPRYRSLEDGAKPVVVVGSDPLAKQQTAELAIAEIDEQLAPLGLSLAKVNWEVVPGSESPEGVTFRFTAPDGTLQIEKTYRLPKIAELAGKEPTKAQRDNLAGGYLLEYAITIRNLSNVAKKLEYVMQGPVGVPLENPENVTKYRDVRVGFLLPDGVTVESSHQSATDVLNAEAAGKPSEWTRPLAYVGVDATYFAALLHPVEVQTKDRTIAKVRSEVTYPAQEKHFTDVSATLESVPVALAANTAGPAAEVTHKFQLYAGPKRSHLMAAVGAADVTEYHIGWNPFFFLEPLVRLLVIPMLGLLNGLHSLGINYGIAIILLTIIVRTCLMPLTRKQAQSAQRMKEMQPKLKELQKKFAGDQDGLRRAQLELYSKHGFNPLAGCWPVLLQMPIFFALYRALSVSIDLRRASFLWIDNLAAPDALFELPFRVPFLGWTEFNLLPFLTIALFVAQQKILMPPPADEEQAMQYKMMNIMMIMMGVMFYRVPAGLCIYFITSSLWGMGERLFFDRLNEWYPSKPVEVKEKKPSTVAKFWQQALEAADRQAEQARQLPPASSQPSTKGNNSGKGRLK